MVQEPKVKRGMPRSLIYILIPLGFILMVAWMVLSGRDTADTAAEAAAQQEEVAPAPSQGASGATN